MSDYRISDPLLRKIVYSVGVMAVIAFGFYTFSLLKEGIALILSVLTPFLTAFFLAYVLAPVVITLQRHLKLGRIMGTLVLYVIVFLMGFLLLVFLIPTVISEFIGLFNTLKQAVPSMIEKLSDATLFKTDTRLFQIIAAQIRDIEIDFEKIIATLLPGLKQMATGGLSAVGAATKSLFHGLGSALGFGSFLIFVGIINFYLIADWEKIRPIIRKMIPRKNRTRTFDILEKIDIAVGGFLRGQLTVSLIVGSLFAIGLFIMGFVGFPALRNYCLLIGTAAAIGGFIPYLGAVMGVAPAILIILATGGMTLGAKAVALGGVLALFAAIQAVEGFVLQPKIVGKGAGLHPLAVMLALLFGGQFGIGGMMIAVPLASVVRVMILEFYWLPLERRESSGESSETEA